MDISEILDKLVGSTSIWCETNHDNESMENLDVIEEVASWLYERITDNLKYETRSEYSAQRIVKRTKDLIINSGLDLLGSELETEARPFQEYKEMIQDVRKEEMIKGLYDLSKNVIRKGKEIEKLNNIINEIEEDLYKIRELTFTKYNSNEWNNCLSFNDDILPVINKIKELKEEK